jgi:tRNA threonylcarbamoyladenosine biosynthesis protein TsaB
LLKIFGIETSSPLFSLCITEDDHIVHMVKKSRLHDDTSRDGKFFQEAEHLLETSAAGPIDAIAVAIGPGMFTSLRIGLSLAKGLALARKIALVGVNTLDVIGSQFFFIDKPVCAVINAYHDEIYAALYRGGERITEYTLTTPQELEAMLEQDTIIMGSGIDVIKKQGVSYRCGCTFVDDEANYPDAAKVVRAARIRIQDCQYDDPDTLEPFYLKQTDAERNYNKKNAR